MRRNGTRHNKTKYNKTKYNKTKYNKTTRNKREKHKIKKRTQYGRGFTITEDLEPYQYRDYEYNQLNNMINYEPKI